ncbi:hypothetical protein [Aurantimonas marina]|uniref:hypothetical protein n=1 Tax=Aurantimonas marina TaxID=2780508 RepID=UPI0019D1007F|nr:hypothetical protein [Aurantimonas marina]
MRTSLFALFAFTTLATATHAQSAREPTPGAPQAPAIIEAPQGAGTPPPATDAAPAANAETGTEAAASPGPANLCTELVAFLTPAPEEDVTVVNDQSAGQPSAGNQAPAAQADRPQATAAGGPASEQPQQQATSSGESAAENEQQAAGVPDGNEAGSAQEASNQAGAAVEAPSDANAPAPNAGNADNAPQTSGLSAPIPQTPEATKKQPDMTLAEAEALAEANDIAGCHTAARKMRREGVDMPPALMALAALDLQHQQNAADRAPAAGEPR